MFFYWSQEHVHVQLLHSRKYLTLIVELLSDIERLIVFRGVNILRNEELEH